MAQETKEFEHARRCVRVEINPALGSVLEVAQMPLASKPNKMTRDNLALDDFSCIVCRRIELSLN
jgi:hypothetical protein